MTQEYEFNYSYQQYEGGVFGKCVEMPSISAQDETYEKVSTLLHEMTKDYLELVKNTKKIKENN